MALSIGAGGGGGGGFGIPMIGNLGGIFGGGKIPGGYSSYLDYFRSLVPGSTGGEMSFTDPMSEDPSGQGTGNQTNNIPFGTSELSKILQVILGTGGAAGAGSILTQILHGLTGKAGSGGNDLIGQLTALLGGVGIPLYGAVQAQNQQDWQNAAKISTLNYLQRLGAGVEGQLGSTQGSYLPDMINFMNSQRQRTSGLQDLAGWNNQNMIENAPGAFNGVTDPSRVPGTAELMQYLAGLQGVGGNALQNLQGNLAGGPLSQGLQTATGLSTGQNPYAKQLEGIAGGLTSGLGSTAFQANPATQQASQVAASILGKNPLLSMDQIKSMAVDQNARQALNSKNTLRRQLLNRTGVTGPALASGQQNELLGSLEDQGLQSQAAGLTNAILGQQGLQSQLFGQGANLFGSAQGATNQQGQLDLSKILGGAGLLSGNQGLNISALNALANLAGTQNQGYGTLGNLLSTLTGTGVAGQNAQQNLQNFGLQSQKSLYDTLGSLLANQTNLGNQAQTGFLQSANFPQNTYDQNLNFLQSLANNNVGLFGGNVAPQNFFKVNS